MAECSNCDHCGKALAAPSATHNPTKEVVWCVDCFILEINMLRQLSLHSFDIEYILDLAKNNTEAYGNIRWNYPDNVEKLQKVPYRGSLATTQQAVPVISEEQDVVVIKALCKKKYYGIAQCSCGACPY